MVKTPIYGGIHGDQIIGYAETAPEPKGTPKTTYTSRKIPQTIISAQGVYIPPKQLPPQEQAKLEKLQSQVKPVVDVSGRIAYYRSISGKPVSSSKIIEMKRLQTKKLQLQSGSTRAEVQRKFIEAYNKRQSVYTKIWYKCDRTKEWGKIL